VIVTGGAVVVVTAWLSWNRPLVAVVGVAGAAMGAAGWSGAPPFRRCPLAYAVIPLRLSIVIAMASARRVSTEVMSGERLRFGMGGSAASVTPRSMKPG